MRVGGRKVTGIAAHRGRAGSMVHGTVLVRADLDALRACVAGRRDGELEGLPRPSPSRPDHVTNTEVDDVADRLCAVLGAEPGELTAAEREAAAELRRTRYEDPGVARRPVGGGHAAGGRGAAGRRTPSRPGVRLTRCPAEALPRGPRRRW